MAIECNDELVMRTVVYAEDEIEDAPLGEWCIADGVPFVKQLTTDKSRASLAFLASQDYTDPEAPGEIRY